MNYTLCQRRQDVRNSVHNIIDWIGGRKMTRMVKGAVE